jgi:hypothetical protein
MNQEVVSAKKEFTAYSFWTLNFPEELKQTLLKTIAKGSSRPTDKVHLPIRSGSLTQPPALIVLSAKNEERLHERVRQLQTWVQAGTSGTLLLNLCLTGKPIDNKRFSSKTMDCGSVGYTSIND